MQARPGSAHSYQGCSHNLKVLCGFFWVRFFCSSRSRPRPVQARLGSAHSSRGCSQRSAAPHSLADAVGGTLLRWLEPCSRLCLALACPCLCGSAAGTGSLWWAPGLSGNWF